MRWLAEMIWPRAEMQAIRAKQHGISNALMRMQADIIKLETRMHILESRVRAIDELVTGVAKELVREWGGSK